MRGGADLHFALGGGGRTGLFPEDVFRTPAEWEEIARPVFFFPDDPVVVVRRGVGGVTASWLAGSPFDRGFGAFSLGEVRYFRWRGEATLDSGAVAPTGDIPAPSPVATGAKAKREKPKRALVENGWFELVDTKERATKTGFIGEDARIHLKVRGYDAGDKIAVTVHWADTHEQVAELSARVRAGGAAAALWRVPEKIGERAVIPRESVFYSVARDDGDEVKGPKITIEPLIWEMYLGVDPDDPEAFDDELILIDGDGTEVERIPVAGMPRIGEHGARLKFERMRPHVRYWLLRDYGGDHAGGGPDTIFSGLTLAELKDIAREHGSEGR